MALTNITLTIPRELTTEEQEMLRYLFADAFGEFQAHRGPTSKEYVDNRYPESEGYKLNREKKIAEVDMRKSLAEDMRVAALVSMGVVKIEPPLCTVCGTCTPIAGYGGWLCQKAIKESVQQTLSETA